MSVDLSTTYLGMNLANPVVVSACPMSAELDQLQRLEEAGVSAAVFPSLFEEQIEHEGDELSRVYDFHTDSFAESLTYFPDQKDFHTGPGEYLETIAAAKKAVRIPIIASLNGSSHGGWIRYAKMMQDAGADALELNIYFVAADPDMTGRGVESRYLELVSAVKESISIPLAVKIGPYFSAMANMGVQLSDAGADGLVLFNRFFQPDIDLETLEARPQLHLSTPSELMIPLRWIAILHGRIRASLAASGGIHDATGLVKILLAGADVGMIASVLYRKGVAEAGRILADLRHWLEDHEYESVEQLKGSMSLENSPDPTAFQRGNYMKTLTSYVGKDI
ncbi:MAG: dihydroorotate dehydrogenase-like protein [Planctomycetaceae bacterium]|nr:dihydroorotate dehydrogenase-like protein [Planctomycetaceae bacterium]